jgi:DNA-binding LytR/AlgR family response regulator
MLHIYICEDEEIQLNCIKDILTEYIADLRIDARIAAARQDPEEIMAGVIRRIKCQLRLRAEER